MSSLKILVTGASGFLGGIIAQNLAKDHHVAITYNKRPININSCESFHMNFFEPKTVQNVIQNVKPNVVIHCAAQPNGAICQKDYKQAEIINVKGTKDLLDTLIDQDTLFIHISTDLIYDGSHSFYSEVDTPKPLSIYGQTKLRAEQIVQAKWKNHLIFRTALMYGPVSPSGKGSFVQWMDHALKQGQSIKLFDDEFRTPLFAPDFSKLIRNVLVKNTFPHRLYNFGGPERVNRVELGYQLAELRGYDKNLIEPVKLSEMSTGYPRPADVSMNSLRIQSTFNLPLSSIKDGLLSIL